jgi:hypothetical protein
MKGKRVWIEAIAVGSSVLAIASAIAWYLTFAVPRQLGRAPDKAPRQISFGREHPDTNRRFHLTAPDPNLTAWQEDSACTPRALLQRCSYDSCAMAERWMVDDRCRSCRL